MGCEQQRKILAFAAVVEIGTGLGLAVAPAIIVVLLVGAELSGVGLVLGRCFGITLVALGLACWPGRRHTERASPALGGMLTYNVLIALYLAYLGTLGHLRGYLLWPAVALHGVMALLLMWIRRGKRRIMAARE